MKLGRVVERCRKLCAPYRITDGGKFNLKDIAPNDRGKFRNSDKPAARDTLKVGVKAICNSQERLYAQDQWAVLLIFQAIDAAGKDGAITHVLCDVRRGKK